MLIKYGSCLVAAYTMWKSAYKHARYTNIGYVHHIQYKLTSWITLHWHYIFLYFILIHYVFVHLLIWIINSTKCTVHVSVCTNHPQVLLTSRIWKM